MSHNRASETIISGKHEWKPYYTWKRAFKIIDSLRVRVSDKIIDRMGGKHTLGAFYQVEQWGRIVELIILRKHFSIETLLHELEHYDLWLASWNVISQHAIEDGSVPMTKELERIVEGMTYFGKDAERDHPEWVRKKMVTSVR